MSELVLPRVSVCDVIDAEARRKAIGEKWRGLETPLLECPEPANTVTWLVSDLGAVEVAFQDVHNALAELTRALGEVEPGEQLATAPSAIELIVAEREAHLAAVKVLEPPVLTRSVAPEACVPVLFSRALSLELKSSHDNLFL